MDEVIHMIYSLDIETAPTSPTDNPYALEPFRYAQGLGKITSVAVSGPDGYIKQVHERGEGDESMKGLVSLLKSLKGKEVVAHNAIFDIAWLLQACPEADVASIRWRDTQLLAKWINNGQDAEMPKKSYSLANLVKEYLVGHPMYDEFINVKEEHNAAGVNYEYWLTRGRMDAILTRDLYLCLMNIVPESMLNGFYIEQRCLVPVAKSWNIGIELDKEGAAAILPKITRGKKVLSDKLGKSEGMFTSPKQLSKYLFDELGIVPKSFSKTTGAASTCSDDLKLMHHEMGDSTTGRIIKTILDFKQLKTLETKFINGILSVCEYNGYDTNHSAPRMFSTYTGRFTYSSKTLKAKYKPGIATHQLPRKGPTRTLMSVKPGRMLGELDAAAQEMRGMAVESKDAYMIDSFNKKLDLHGGMGAHIAGMPYDSYMAKYKDRDEEAINYRYAGKLLNLSCQYRIGSNAIAKKFFTTYGIVIEQHVAASYLSMYKSRYPGVVQYWEDSIMKGKVNGYAESVSGRRYYLTKWNSMKWGTESSAVNFPIQGFGADHKELAIAAAYDKFPEADLILDLHDGLWYSVPEVGGEELLLEMRDYISHLPYAEMWNKDIPVNLLFDAQSGPNFLDIKEL
jgi:DNA polymerase I-like protein with 3'-5' exonuclease and polymerase domains